MNHAPWSVSRRTMLRRCSSGFGLAALAALMQEPAFGGPAAFPGGPKVPEFRPRAKNVILCYMSGGVSQVDSFDPKPMLEKFAGQPLPGPIERTQFNNNGNLLPSFWKFKNHGRCGLPVSELFSNVGACADDLCVVRSMTAKFSEHAQGNYFLHTGFPFLGHPSAGAWVSYGLGSVARNLPGFVVLQAGGSTVPHGGVGVFGNGFLPATHQASLIDADAPEPIRNIRPKEADASQRRRLAFLADMDHQFAHGAGDDPQIESAIANYEMAYQMQSAVPELVDIGGETEATRKLYGLDSPDPKKAAYAHQCLLARRLVERGVRFVELTCGSYNIGGGNGPNPWDQHGQIQAGHTKMAFQVDQPIAGLLKDLKSRGLLDETLVIWTGEFGRTPFSQGGSGRDHDPFGFSLWMAGGGIRGGMTWGATDDFGYRAVENPATIYDLWATVLHQLGVDHEKLTYRHGGRDLRLTDVYGNVLHPLIA